MKRKRHIVHKWVHIQIHKIRNTYIKKIAAVLKGIAAIFYSTDFYVFANYIQHIYGVLLFCMVDFIESCIFLFRQVIDKPCFNPGCRSPPSLFVFEPNFKNRTEEKLMNENKQFFIRADGQLVTVTEDVYREFYKMDRRERYLEERDAAHGKVLYSDMDTDEMLGEETIPDMNAIGVEQIVIDGMMVDKLHQCLELLSDDERELLYALFFEGHSEREWSEICGIPRKTIAYRKGKVFSKLKTLLEN